MVNKSFNKHKGMWMNQSHFPIISSQFITSFNKFPYETEVTVLTPNGAFVTVSNVDVDYGSDNVITPGESVNINITLENMGNEISSDVNINLYEIIDNPFSSKFKNI